MAGPLPDKIPLGSRLLELDSGPGNVTRYLVDKRPDLHILATDLAPEMLEVAPRNLPEVEHALLDMRDIGRVQQTFHGFVCAFGLPYLDQQPADHFIRDAASVLHAGGDLYLSTMEDDPSKSGWEGPSADQQILINHRLGKDLDLVLRSEGLVPLVQERVSYTSAHGAADTDLMLVHSK